MKLNLEEARLINIRQQGLADKLPGNMAIIEQLGYVQIDTIAVTERSHNHVFHTRNKDFKPEQINELMNQKLIFEYWSHAAAYLPMRDFRYSLYIKDHYKSGNKHWFPRDPKTDRYVLDRIRAEGPLQSKDFEHPKNQNREWYQWKPAKIALTNLFMDGSIMITERKGFQKVFDLTERVIPDGTITSMPTLNEYCKHLIFNSIRNFGIANIQEIAYLRKGIGVPLKKIVKELEEDHQIRSVQLENLPDQYYTTSDILEKSNHKLEARPIHILNPFDNLVIQRKRVRNIYNFEYQIECYVPEKKRIYGYYALPILYGDQFIGRLDAKANRKEDIFLIKNICLEADIPNPTTWLTAFINELSIFAKFCSCSKIIIEPSVSKKMATLIKPFI